MSVVKPRIDLYLEYLVVIHAGWKFSQIFKQQQMNRIEGQPIIITKDSFFFFPVRGMINVLLCR